MSEIKDVKCNKCRKVCGRRKDNWFAENSIWQYHRRSFSFRCSRCEHLNTFKVNRETAVKLEFAAIMV